MVVPQINGSFYSLILELCQFLFEATPAGCKVVNVVQLHYFHDQKQGRKIKSAGNLSYMFGPN